MDRIDSDQIKEALTRGGKALLEIVRDAYGNALAGVGEEAFSRAIEIGIGNTIAALCETNIDDEQIINLINKHWGIARDEAVDRLVYEKEHAPLRELRSHLRLQGFTKSQIQRFMLDKKIVLRLKSDPALRKLKPTELLSAIE